MEKNKGEIVLYNLNETISIDVRLESETVWLTQAQIAKLFNVGQPAISKHLKNIYTSGELQENNTYSILEYMGNEGMQIYKVKYYNLDAILSIGYRVNSVNATQFRIWANKVLKEYLLRGYSINQRFERLDQRVTETENKIEFFVRTSLPPKEGIFFNGQIFDAYVFVSDLIKKANKRIVLIDNYIDESVFVLLAKRKDNVLATIYTQKITEQLLLDLQKYNEQYAPIELKIFKQSHDRFLIIDDELYLIGASIKDLGKKWFGFSKIESFSADSIMGMLEMYGK